MRLSLGFSTCPNDTFIFDALVNGRVDTEGLEFDIFLGDVEELNRRAFEGKIDITKISYHAYAYLADKYKILNAGSALGYNNGPLLVSKRKIYPDEVEDIKVAIPGKYTTANLLFSIAWPGATDKTEYLFSDIEKAVLDNEMDAGLLIHENRFTYHQRGLKKIADLGEYWDGLTSGPIPLGAICINRDIPGDIALAVDRSLKRSVVYASNNPDVSYPYVKKYAVAMDREVMHKHIDLYVNKYTMELGEEGRSAIRKLFNEAASRLVIKEVREDIFVS